MIPFVSVCFKVFDKDQDGLLNRSELVEMIEAMAIVRDQNTPPQFMVKLSMGFQKFNRFSHFKMQKNHKLSGYLFFLEFKRSTEAQCHFASWWNIEGTWQWQGRLHHLWRVPGLDCQTSPSTCLPRLTIPGGLSCIYSTWSELSWTMACTIGRLKSASFCITIGRLKSASFCITGNFPSGLPCSTGFKTIDERGRRESDKVCFKLFLCARIQMARKES